jgi:acetyltransferase-like isoleucine patch superfamily enzyme
VGELGVRDALAAQTTRPYAAQPSSFDNATMIYETIRRKAFCGKVVKLSSENFALVYARIREASASEFIEPRDDYLIEDVSGITYATTINGPRLEVFTHKGARNTVIAGSGTIMPGRIRINGSENIVYIGPYAKATGSAIDISGIGGIVTIGAFTEIGSGANLKLSGTGSINIGDRCKIGNLCIVGNSDGHAIYSITSGNRTNPDKDVIIGDDVMLGASVKVSKGGIIGSGSAIGENSVVVGAISEHSFFSGIPARLIEANIKWSPRALSGLDVEDLSPEALLLRERSSMLKLRINGK